jgi:hypothetical protein
MECYKSFFQRFTTKPEIRLVLEFHSMSGIDRYFTDVPIQEDTREPLELIEIIKGANLSDQKKAGRF